MSPIGPPIIPAVLAVLDSTAALFPPFVMTLPARWLNVSIAAVPFSSDQTLLELFDGSTAAATSLL